MTSLADEPGIRVLNVIADFNREALGSNVDASLPSERVIRTLKWGIKLEYTRSGKPHQSAYVERFHT